MVGVGDKISWKTVSGSASGTVIGGDAFNGYIVLLANGKHVIVGGATRKSKPTPTV